MFAGLADEKRPSLKNTTKTRIFSKGGWGGVGYESPKEILRGKLFGWLTSPIQISHRLLIHI